jgi:hypothetical protein
MSFVPLPSSDNGASVDVSVTNFPTTQDVSVTNFPTTQDVSVINFPTTQDVEITNASPINVSAEVTNLPTDLVAVSRGVVTGSYPFGAFGKRTASGSVSLQILWPDGTFTLPPSAGIQMSFVSSSTDDTSAGVGARTVKMVYLDANLNEQSETITMGGTTPVLSVATNIRFIQNLFLLTFGSSKSAVGTITVSNGGTVYGQVSPGELRCTSSARMVPNGKRLFVNSLYASSVSGGSSETTVAFSSSVFMGHDYSADSVFFPIAQGGFQDNGMTMKFDPPLSFEEGTCVAMQYTQTSTATVTSGWFGWIETM